jgi:integration host factor subunit alpha
MHGKFPGHSWIVDTISRQYRHLSVLKAYLPIGSLSEGGSMSGTLAKADLISEIQTENGYTYNRSSDIVETLLEIIKRTLESGEPVMITGFGKFQVREKGEQKGQNLATGGDLILAPRKVVTFKCAGRLRERINRG